MSQQAASLPSSAPERHCATCKCGQPKKKRSGTGIKRTSADDKWSKEVRARDGYTCQWPGCGKVYEPNSQGLHAAHCFGRRCGTCTGSRGGWKKPHECARLDLGNGLALCWPHHTYADQHTNEKYDLFLQVLGRSRFNALSAKARGRRDRISESRGTL